MSSPRLLLLDEPSLGLAPVAVKEVFALIERLRGRGLTILLVQQNVRQALGVADRAHVLEGGRVVCQGQSKDLIDDELVVSSYLGASGMEDQT